MSSAPANSIVDDLEGYLIAIAAIAADLKR
ncbi:MAG: hypothetical protein QOH24_2396 [Verrucomicrobiota bacterium]